MRCLIVGTGGFESRGEPPSQEDPPDAPPPGFIGGLLSEQPVLFRRPNLVAYLTKVRAYPTGVLFQVAIEERQPDVLERVMDWDEDVQVAVTVEGSQHHPDVDRLGSEASSGEEGASWLAEYWVSRAPDAGQFIVEVTIVDLVGIASLPGALLQAAAARAIDFFERAR